MINLFDSLLEGASIVSLDVFDTAILRTVVKPTDVFYLTQQRYEFVFGNLGFDFPRIRVEAESKARDFFWKEYKYLEVSLNDIYFIIWKDYKIDGPITEKLKFLEVETELKVCQKNDFIFDLYRNALNKGIQVVFTSDMYLPCSIIKEILYKNEYRQYNKLYLSSEYKVTKSSGYLFDVLIKDNNCNPENILHIGDNYDSDYLRASEKKFKVFHYEKNFDRAVKDSYINKSYLERFDNYNFSSLYNSVIINKYYSSRAEIKSDIHDFWYMLGYQKVGILLFSFVKWIIANVKENKFDKVYFLARDGYILHKIYEIFKSDDESIPEAEYLFASRRMLNFAKIKDLNEDDIKFLISGTTTLTVDYFLKRIGLNSNECYDKILKAGFSSPDQYVITADDYRKLRALFISLNAEIIGKSAEEREDLLGYFNSIGLLNSKNVAVVDIGWHGSLQKSILEILSDINPNIVMKGFYLGTWENAKLNFTSDIHGYLFNYSNPQHLSEIVKLSVELFEFFHLAPHGSVVRMNRMSSGYYPVFDENVEEHSKFQIISKLHNGVIDFVNDYKTVNENFYYLEPVKEEIINPIKELLLNPSVEELVRLGDLKHAEGFGNYYVSNHIAKPSKFIFPSQRVIKEYKKSYWKQGYLKRLPGYLSNYVIRRES